MKKKTLGLLLVMFGLVLLSYNVGVIKESITHECDCQEIKGYYNETDICVKADLEELEYEMTYAHEYCHLLVNTNPEHFCTLNRAGFYGELLENDD